MKKARTVKPSEDETELRRWCIEQAMRWPTSGSYGMATIGGGIAEKEADIIGRAMRLLNWVKSR